MNRAGRIGFTKLEALGNDFVLIDARTVSFEPSPAAVGELGDRRRGIGFDQLLVLRPPRQSRSHCAVTIFNNDGTGAEQCGNGMRAIALWLHDRGEFERSVKVDTPAATVELAMADRERITATLSVPDFSPAACGLAGQERFPVELTVHEATLRVFGVSLGNPHLIVVCERPADHERLREVGGGLSVHPRLDQGANVGLAHVAGENRIDLRVFERGAGPTPACGSGAGAAAAVLIRQGRVRSPVEVAQPGGTLVINWHDEGEPISMTGPAREVFEGTFPWPT